MWGMWGELEQQDFHGCGVDIEWDQELWVEGATYVRSIR